MRNCLRRFFVLLRYREYKLSDEIRIRRVVASLRFCFLKNTEYNLLSNLISVLLRKLC